MDIVKLYKVLISFHVIFIVGLPLWWTSLKEDGYSKEYFTSKVFIVLTAHFTSAWGIAFLTKNIQDIVIGSVVFTFLIINYPQKKEISRLIEHLFIMVASCYIFRECCDLLSAKFLERDWLLLLTLASELTVFFWRRGLFLKFLYANNIPKE